MVEGEMEVPAVSVVKLGEAPAEVCSRSLAVVAVAEGSAPVAGATWVGGRSVPAAATVGEAAAADRRCHSRSRAAGPMTFKASPSASSASRIGNF